MHNYWIRSSFLLCSYSTGKLLAILIFFGSGQRIWNIYRLWIVMALFFPQDWRHLIAPNCVFINSHINLWMFNSTWKKVFVCRQSCWVGIWGFFSGNFMQNIFAQTVHCCCIMSKQNFGEYLLKNLFDWLYCLIERWIRNCLLLMAGWIGGWLSSMSILLFLWKKKFRQHLETSLEHFPRFFNTFIVFSEIVQWNPNEIQFYLYLI